MIPDVVVWTCLLSGLLWMEEGEEWVELVFHDPWAVHVFLILLLEDFLPEVDSSKVIRGSVHISLVSEPSMRELIFFVWKWFW